MNGEAHSAIDRPQFASLLESMSNGAIAVDSDRTVVYANRGALGMLGQRREAVVGQAVSGAFRVFFERAQSRTAADRLARFEHFYDGNWYIIQVFPLLGADGLSETPYTIVTATDISERKKREFEFLEIAAGLEEATRIAEMGTFKVLWGSLAIQWSPHAYIIHGVRPETYHPGGGNYAELVHPEDRGFVTRAGRELVEGKPVANLQYRIVRPDGVVRWMRMDGRILFDSSGAGYASFGTIQDITDAKQREHELQELLKRNAILYEALEASPIGVAVLTAEESGLSMLYVNAAFERLTQHNSYSLNVDGLRALVADGDRDQWQSIADYLTRSEPGSFDASCRRRDGTVFPARIELAPVRDYPGREATAFVVNLRDMTSDRERAAALLQSQKMEALGQLSGGVAHEINNLLQPVIALSDLGGDVLGKDTEKARKYFEVIGGSGRKAREVVRQVLTFARRDTPQLSAQDVVPLVADAVNLAAKGLPPQLDVKTDIRLTEARAVISATQVSQVMLNLLRNASDAMKGQGVVTVTLNEETVVDGAPKLAGLKPGRWIKLTVQDTGCGMDRDTLSRVFEPFFTTKPVGKGTGLGLSVVYSIVAGWGGTISLDSEVDRGTTAVIYIPLHS
ncbi:MAG: PAS domain S-box protein [Rhodospirillaceae bacterium]|nr:PAS domain S-box protein [Rhodospirillaceae bacterium]